MREVLQQMLPALKPGAIVTDVGSVKSSVGQELEPLVASVGASANIERPSLRRHSEAAHDTCE